MRKMKKSEVRNIKCPFCAQTIKGKVPEGLNLDKVIALINKIKDVKNISCN
jgi:MoaA/NifB/PqqE/SkfB family radical SAM enzyme